MSAFQKQNVLSFHVWVEKHQRISAYIVEQPFHQILPEDSMANETATALCQSMHM